MQLLREISCKVNFVSGAFMSVMSFFNTAPTSTILFLNLLWCRFIGFLFIFLILFLNEFFLLFRRFRRLLDLLSLLFVSLEFLLLFRLIRLTTKFAREIHLVFAFRLLLIFLKSFPFECFSHSYVNVVLANSIRAPNVSIYSGLSIAFSLLVFVASLAIVFI